MYQVPDIREGEVISPHLEGEEVNCTVEVGCQEAHRREGDSSLVH